MSEGQVRMWKWVNSVWLLNVMQISSRLKHTTIRLKILLAESAKH